MTGSVTDFHTSFPSILSVLQQMEGEKESESDRKEKEIEKEREESKVREEGKGMECSCRIGTNNNNSCCLKPGICFLSPPSLSLPLSYFSNCFFCFFFVSARSFLFLSLFFPTFCRIGTGSNATGRETTVSWLKQQLLEEQFVRRKICSPSSTLFLTFYHSFLSFSLYDFPSKSSNLAEKCVSFHRVQKFQETPFFLRGKISSKKEERKREREGEKDEERKKREEEKDTRFVIDVLMIRPTQKNPIQS